jgi:hypothetical protein
MSLSVDLSIAEKVLISAFSSKSNTDNDYTKIIKRNLEGGHKTYKYVLMTGLLAKATNEQVNPLALQAGSSLDGAYDARSLCHKVFVPFERKYLNNVLGGSNEPFLNKPARFAELSTNNAVRAGKDLKTLKELIELLTNIKSKKEANDYLIFALNILSEKIESDKKNGVVHVQEIKEGERVFELISFLTQKSFEGETAVIVVTAIERLLSLTNESNFSIIPHKVNQSGASSKEVGDIDVYFNKIIKFSLEVKDKDFSEYDLQHAFDKMRKANLSKGFFIAGPRANWNKEEIVKLVNAYNKQGFLCNVFSFDEYIRSSVMRIDFEDNNLGDVLIQASKDINCKLDTTNWLMHTLQILSLI